MKTQIRNKVWETNSSSVHAFCFSTKGLEKCRLKIHEDGYVHVRLNKYFGKDEEQFFDQTTKLKYVLTWMYVYYYGYHDYNRCNLEEEYLFHEFSNEFAKYVIEHNDVKCLGIKIDGYRWREPYDYFDHQQLTDGYTGDKCIVNIWYPKECVEFIFNRYVGLHTGCD